MKPQTERADQPSLTQPIYDDVYLPMKAENTQLQETEWAEDRQVRSGQVFA